jgi:hypothetical protein
MADKRRLVHCMLGGEVLPKTGHEVLDLHVVAQAKITLFQVSHNPPRPPLLVWRSCCPADFENFEDIRQ